MKQRPLPSRSIPAASRSPAPAAGFNPNRPFAPPEHAVQRAPLEREISAAAAYLRQIRLELAALGANELAKDRIPAAGRELDDIIEDGGEFSNAIMSAAEQVMDAGEMEPADYRTLVTETMTTIIVQCAFQDITAQRAKRIRGILDVTERRLSRLATFAATREMPDIVDFDVAPMDLPVPQAGPPPRGEGNAQADIDRILAAPQVD